MISGLLFAGALWIAGGDTPAKPTPSPALDPKDIAAFQALAEQVQSRQCPASITDSEALAARLERSNAPAELKSAVDMLVAICAVDHNQIEPARVYAVAATQYAEADDGAWRLRFGAELQLGRFEDAAMSLIEISKTHRPLFEALDPTWIYQLRSDLRKKGGEVVRERLDQAMIDANYAPPTVLAPLDAFHLDYAEILAGRGDVKGARAQIDALLNPDFIVGASLEPSLRSLFPTDPDVRKGTERYLAAARQIMAAKPDQLSAVTDAAQALRLLGRYEEAARLMQPYKARLDRGEKFADDDRANWWWDGLASTLAGLGDYSGMVDAYRRGGARDESGSLNVSQIINLADLQVAYHRPAEAIETLKAFEDPKRHGSPYGDMQMHAVRGCARYLAGDTSGAAEDLAYIDAHETDAPNGAVELHLCRGERDRAAAVAIRWLNAKEGPATALRALSKYAAPPAPLANDPMHAGEDELALRPDVKAVLDRVGGVRSFNILSSGF